MIEAENATGLFWKSLLVVWRHFRALNACHLRASVYDGVIYRDSVREITPTRKMRAA